LFFTDEQAGRARSLRSIYSEPLVDNENDEVTEDTQQKDELWNEFTQDAQRVVEIPATRSISRLQLLFISRNYFSTSSSTRSG